jgi:hypothetical protein
MYLGAFNPGSFEEPAKELNLAYGLGGTFKFPISRVVALGLDVEGWQTARQYEASLFDSSPWVITSDYVNLETKVLLLGARVLMAPLPRLRIYGSASACLYFSSLSQTTVLVFLPFAPGEAEERDTTFGCQAGAGVELDLGRWVFSLDYRRWIATEALSSLGAEEADLGGNFIGLGVGTYLFHPGRRKRR